MSNNKMKYTIIPLILHVPEGESGDDTILGIKGFANKYYNAYVSVCEASEWKESDDYVFRTPNLTNLPKSENQF